MKRRSTLRSPSRLRRPRPAETLEPRQLLTADLVISELMASNVATLADEDGTFSDWLEIRNTTAGSVNLAGWSLTDDPADLDKWVLPNQSLAAGAHLVIFASGKDRATPGQELHTNFKLSGNGEYLALVQPGGTIFATEFTPNFPDQFDDISYGYNGALTTLGYFPTPTPGALNSGDQVSDPSQDVVISEIMYHAQSATPTQAYAEDYIEIYNRGQLPVDLTGWQFAAGVPYTFPSYTLGVGQYVVIPDTLAAFQAKYPAVTNVLPGWNNSVSDPSPITRPGLSDSTEGITLSDADGDTVDRVEYADEGEWGQRRQDFPGGGTVGWTWFAAHDGNGSSLELVNLDLSNNSGQNWLGSAVAHGTPGAVNSVSSSNSAPLIEDMEQSPLIPRSSDAVNITARLTDEAAAGVTGTVFYRIGSGGGAFTAVAMADDGLHGDGLAGDGVFGATLPAQANNTIIEYYYQASDAGANTRTYPTTAKDNSGTVDLGHATNFLYQVDNTFDPSAVWTPGTQPFYRLILTSAEYTTFASINRNSSAAMNATFVAMDGTGTTSRHEVALRIRGNSSRNLNPPPMRLDFPHDRYFDGRSEFGFNVRNTFNQLAGNAVFRAAGLQAPDSLPIHFQMNNSGSSPWGSPVNGSYIRNELLHGDFLADHLPNDPGGNVYRKRRNGAAWDYFNDPSGVAYQNDLWEKQSNEQLNDWTDLDELMRVVNQTPAGPAYYAALNVVADVDQWVSWFALMQLIDSRETNLSNGADDDYEFYTGAVDRRFRIFPHDLDAIMGRDENGQAFSATADGIFQPLDPGGESIPQLNNFFSDPVITQKYYAALQHHISTTLSAATLNPLLDQALGGFTPQATIDAMKTWQAQRNAYVLGLIPTQFTIVSPLPLVNGYPATSNSGISLSGQADVSLARSVTVNGQAATLNSRTGAWTFNVGGSGGNTETLIAQGSTWKYLANGSNQGTVWDDVSFDDSAWPSGGAQIGTANEGDAVTGIPLNITTYFRKTFNVDDVSQVLGLTLRLLADDGAVVYLNGTEVQRDNMPLAPTVITSSTLALVNRTATSNPPENTFLTFNLPASALVSGNNVIAVELHNVTSTNNDLSFDLSLDATLSGGGGGGGFLNPGINRLTVQSFDEVGGTGNVVDSGVIDVWFNDGNVTTVGGTLPAGTTTWTPANGPYQVTSDLTVPAGATLVIQPGTSVYFDAGIQLTVNGTLQAEGTEFQRIRLTRTPGVASRWDGLFFSGSNQDNRLAYLDMEWAGGGGDNLRGSNSTISVDHVEFLNTTGNIQIVDLNNSSLRMTNSKSPDVTSVEAYHLSGLPAGGYFIFQGNEVGRTTGFNDVMDLTGGNRPGAIVQILDNWFWGCEDDILDLDSTDAHIEGNVFLSTHKNGGAAADTSSAISGGADNADTSEWTIVRNFFYDQDHGILAKEGASAVLVNNTFVNVDFSIVNFDEPGNGTSGPGAGAVLDGNVIWDAPAIFQNTDAGTSITVHRNIFPVDPGYSGVGNLMQDPRLVNTAAVTDPRVDFKLRPGSPALGSGPNGADMGADVPAGATISGEPAVQTSSTSATLTVGGPDLFGYKYSLDGGAFSAEQAPGTPLALAGLAAGPHSVRVVKKNSAGVWQAEAAASVSRTWTVNPALARLLVNEVLAINTSAVNNGGTFPDAIELYNAGAASVNLAGMSISDSASNPTKYVFPAGTTLAAGAYLVLYADQPSAAPGLHLGFSLDNSGEGVFLYNSPAAGGALVDSVEFGLQLANLSIGRVGQDQHWTLNQPTLGGPNAAERTGDTATLKINEWFQSGDVRLVADYLELYNPDALPVDLGGLYLTDKRAAVPDKHPIAPLNFVAAGGFGKLTADENASAGLNHLNFRLSGQTEIVALNDASLQPVDMILYYSPTTDYSQGRNPNGAVTLANYRLPTPNLSNASSTDAAALALLDNLRITEIMYNPAGLAATEFVELRNVGAGALNLAGVRLSGGIEFTFPAMTLNPNQYVVVVEDLAAFRAAYGTTVNVAGEYSGSLSNGGDEVVLQLPDPFEAAVLRFDYDDAWYPTTDGGGRALVIRNQAARYNTWDEAGSWQAGTPNGGSPGRGDADPPPIVLTVNALTTADTTPPLSGTLNYPAAAVSVTVGGNTYPAVNNGNGTWSLADNVVAPALAPGVYDVTVAALDGLGNLGTDVTTGELSILGSQVVARRVFYNNSLWDGNNAAANASDDAAIATDKSALLPGQTASFANYTSFSKGINGLMIDVQSPAGTIGAGDFAFRTGNNNSPGAWSVLATAPSVSLRAGAGVGGSTRVTLIWPDGAITKRWLQVTLLSNANTGLVANDVFYFGNAVAESGNSTSDAVVNATDEINARTHPVGPFATATIVNLYDYNRDRLVNATDQIIARTNGTNPLTALRLISVPAETGSGAAAAGAELAGLGEALEQLATRRRRR